MRTSAAILTGTVVGALAAGAAYLVVARSPASLADVEPSGRESPSVVAPAPRVDLPKQGARPSPPSSPPRLQPVTPEYRSTSEGARPIYRCTSRGGTVYTNEPCAGATVVADARGAAGYDTRPSDRLAQLVADGRTAEAEAPPVAARSRVPPRESVECGNLRQQIRDLDAAAAYPNARETLDEWRRIRQDIRTSMARSHC